MHVVACFTGKIFLNQKMNFNENISNNSIPCKMTATTSQLKHKSVPLDFIYINLKFGVMVDEVISNT